MGGMAAVWTGVLSVGLVSIAVKLHTARQTHGPTTHQFERGTSDRVRQKRVNERTGEEVPAAEIVRGAEVGRGRYVPLEKAELERIAPGRSKTIEVDGFVDAGAVDPLWYSSVYYLSPDGPERPYVVLLRALERTGKAGVATMVMRDREHLVLIGPQQGVLTAATLFWADEVRDPGDLMDVPDVEAEKRDLDLAEQLVAAMAVDWEPELYEDEYHKRLQALIEAKAQGETISYPERPAAPVPTVVELDDALRKSLAERRARRAPSPRSPDGRGKSKAELQAEAAELGVRGRSRMGKAELARAVAQARTAHAS